MNLELLGRDIPPHLMRFFRPVGFKPKDLMNIPAMLAEALRRDGWYLRSDIIWSKPNPMPGSVKDRPNQSHEYLFLFSKSRVYYYDWWAVREKSSPVCFRRGGGGQSGRPGAQDDLGKVMSGGGLAGKPRWFSGTRNKRTVWTVPPRHYRDTGEHFATFPPDLVVPCIEAGTSQHGACVACGAPYQRIVKPTEEYARHLGRDWGGDGSYGKDAAEGRGRFDLGDGRISTTRRTKRDAPSVCAAYEHAGWEQTCQCVGAGVSPCVVLDPFFGAGTTGLVASIYNRNFVGIELNPKYANIAKRRIEKYTPLGSPFPEVMTLDEYAASVPQWRSPDDPLPERRHRVQPARSACCGRSRGQTLHGGV